MANLLYRVTSTPEARTVTEVKGTPLTNPEMDTNFILINAALQDIIDGINNGTIFSSNTIEWATLKSIPAAISSIAGLTTAANTMIYTSASNVYETTTLTAAGRTFLAATDAAGQRLAIGSGNADNLTSGTVDAARLPAGSIINAISQTYATSADLTTAIPLDDTIPQIGEGTEIATVTITPKATNSRLRIRVSGRASNSVAGNVSFAVFRDSTANAISAVTSYVDGAAESAILTLEDEVTAGSTSPTTFRLRAGSSVGTMRCNGSSSGRHFGGASKVYLVVEEIKA